MSFMENNKQQTAVDYLLKELSDLIGQVEMSGFNTLLMTDAIKKAKEMEKEQIINARHNGIISAMKGYAVSNEQYYNETYGTE